MPERRSRIERETTETKVVVELCLDGPPQTSISTGVAFFDHMLDQLGRHAGFDLTVEASGDLDVDAHHTVEDVGLALGDALREALGGKYGIARYGSALVPMEDALVQVALDLSGRPYLARDVPNPSDSVGGYDTALTNEFMRAIVNRAGITLHVRLLDGRDPHHIIEGEFKALARALTMACAVTGGTTAPSTKGVLD
ncbi:MAG TPA: imidazoleglycerol-phosphate dehydratase HisB [Actinomycetota bacterium]|nr:imidazoleglycerol-phosphate dehydratase HisB [Actinomycetota bacterium]